MDKGWTWNKQFEAKRKSTDKYRERKKGKQEEKKTEGRRERQRQEVSAEFSSSSSPSYSLSKAHLNGPLHGFGLDSQQIEQIGLQV